METTETAEATVQTEKKVAVHEHIVAALPIALVAVGGALGGACGGAAYGCSLAVFKKEIAPWKKYLFSSLISVGAVLIYFVGVIALAVLFPSLFQQ